MNPIIKRTLNTWLYDEPTGLLTNKVYADGKGPTYAYAPDGKLATRTWARGIITEYAYDGWGNLTNTVYSDGTPTITLFYDTLGRRTEAHDAAGITTFNYDSFGSITNETVIGVAGTNTIIRHWDEFGRSAGYTFNNVRQSTLAYDPATARLATMLANGSDTPFTWSYLPGSDLKSTLSYPNGLTASWQFDANNQLIQVCNAFPTNIISQYDYTYDAIGRRTEISRSGSAMSETRADVYGYNIRNELISAAKSVGASSPTNEYAYQYDDIGNRISSFDLGTNRTYTANNLNQYTSISNFYDSLPSVALAEEGAAEFIPQFDDDGNQTLIQTSTGIWSVTYNGENRPVFWSNGETNVVMQFDRMGRRVQCLEACSSSTNANNTFTYNNYLLIARHRDNLNGAFSNDQFIWDPTESIATRPLVFYNSNAPPQYYTHDGNKNVSDLTDSTQNATAHYEYTPFGTLLSSSGSSALSNSLRFSSEYADDTLGLVYYNYRHYNSLVGRWSSRDFVGELGGISLYIFSMNMPVCNYDILGNRANGSFAKYTFKPKQCELHVRLDWYLKFVSIIGYDDWTDYEKATWMRKAKYAVEGYFNNLPLRCAKEGKCCHCKNGIKVVFNLNFVGEEISLWDRYFGFTYNNEVLILKQLRDSSEVRQPRGDTYLDIDDVDNNGEGTQITIVHEVGHQLGLNHPGMWSGKEANKWPDYYANYKTLRGKDNLMGKGMTLHVDDFNRAFCNYINYDDCDR